MSILETIIATGNRSIRRESINRNDVPNNITCADGFTLSVIAGGSAYSIPKDELFERPEWPGPFSHVEVGYPSGRPEPWDCPNWVPAVHHDDVSDCVAAYCGCDGQTNWQCYFSSGVYPFVPVEMVRALVALHGGEES